MRESLEPRDVYLRLHGKPEFNGRVRASVFAAKLAALARASDAADLSRNGGKRHELLISKLEAASASATLTEMRVSSKYPAGSALPILAQCAEAIRDGQFAVARRYPECAAQLRNLARGSEDTYSHGELAFSGIPPLRIDQFFFKQAVEATREESSAAARWFKGVATGTFDGKVLEVDLRGSVPKVKLVLTAGGKEIDCVCPTIGVDEIRGILDRRVRLDGDAYYDGKSGLPARITIRSAVPTKEAADFRRWKGAFDPFHPTSWEGDE